MNQQRLLFEHSPLWIIACVAVGLTYAWLLYGSQLRPGFVGQAGKQSWSKRVNQFLFVLRTILVAGLVFLLLGPIIKLTHNIVQKPTLTLIVDNSISIKDATDSLSLQKLESGLWDLKKALGDEGYDVSMRNLAAAEATRSDFKNPTSDLSGAMRNVMDDFEGKNLAGLVVVTDGIYNSGTSPLYSPVRIPVYTVGIGDTTQRVDVVIKNLAYNKIAYQGNQFPLRAEVLVQGIHNQNINVTIEMGGRQNGQPARMTQTKNSGNSQLLDFDFRLDATEKGLQRIDVFVEPLGQESNRKNNRASAFVEVIAGKKKILVIAPAPHPDIKTIRSVVEKNSNYEFHLHIPGVKEDQAMLQPGQADLIIFHQIADIQGKTAQLYSRLGKGHTSSLLVLGSGSNLRQLQPLGIPLSFESTGQMDEVTPVINPAFAGFALSENTNGVFSRYPPMSVPFGKFQYPANASVLLSQKIGSVVTDRPLLFSYDENNHKTGVLMGEGIWRWRLNEFSEHEKTETFDEVFSKLIQYLSTEEDKRKFRSFPIQNEFDDAEPVIFESQVYNDLFEQIYGNKVEIDLRDERGKSTQYNYVLGPGSTRYRMGGLKEGVYHYKASTEIEGRREEVHGEFLVMAQNIEAQNLTADFDLLRKLAARTGGKFYRSSNLSGLQADLKNSKAMGLIHSEEAFNPLIDLKLAFFLLLVLISGEWFLRKYMGGY